MQDAQAKITEDAQIGTKACSDKAFYLVYISMRIASPFNKLYQTWS